MSRNSQDKKDKKNFQKMDLQVYIMDAAARDE